MRKRRNKKKKRVGKKKNMCGSKIAYDSQADTKIAMYQTLRKHYTFRRLRAYKCTYCNKWHVGRTNVIVYNRFKELSK